MAANDNSSLFMSKVSRYVANIPGTNAYWYKVREELKAIVSSKGAPTFFFTFSSADMHWPELHDLLGRNYDDTSNEEKRQNVINNPQIVDWFFTKRLEAFIKHWLYDTLDAEWHWYRYEYQHRGSIHCHGTAKLKNDPGLCQLTEIALKGFLAAKHKKDCANSSSTEQYDQEIQDGLKAAETVCQYVDWLLSTVNPVPPEQELWIRPDIHPCKRRHKDISKYEQDSDYIDLLNTVQCHTKCSTNYCLRKKTNETELKCRFHFPFEQKPQTTLEFEEINSKDRNVKYRAKIVTERNDPRVNNHQRLQLQGWRANCDIQVVIDHYACVEYLTKYAAKSKPKSLLVKQAFSSVMQNVDANSDPQKAMRKIIMKTLGERDYAAQETMHHLFSLKLHSSSFTVIPVSLTGSRRLRINYEDQENDICTDNSLDAYANRDQYDNSPEGLNMNFHEFATKFKIMNNKLHRQPDNVVPRIFPTYSPNPKGKNYPLYCKFQLLKFKPWKTNPVNAWNGQQESDKVYKDAWHDFLNTDYAKSHVLNWIDNLQNVIESNQETISEHDEQQENELEEWMILSNLNKPFESEEYSETDIDWHLDRQNYSQQQIGEMTTWIQTNKQQFAGISNEQCDVIDINTFSEMQRCAYNIVLRHSEDSFSKDPLCLIIIGVAGTGKSYLINALRNCLQRKCVVTATTGKASFNIKGITIHSLLKLPIGTKFAKDLTGESLSRLQASLAEFDYIIIDEFSMLGQTTFGWIDKRCRQATGFHDKLFGGKSLLLIGDPAQLPPVGDKPLFHNHPTNEIAEQGYHAYKFFDKVVKLTVNQRVQGESIQQKEFKDLLSRLRTGDSSLQDWKLLLQHSPDKVTNVAQFENATRLFYTNKDVADYNYQKLTNLKNPIACIEARHSSAYAKKLTSEDMNGLQPVLFLARNSKVMLTMNLWPSVGLCNGATGTVVDFIYDNNLQPPSLPIAVIVQFDEYDGPSILENRPKCVPICLVTITLQMSATSHERQQLPLKLAWALTIHKSQGLTLPKTVIDLGKSERTPGISYVAISRVKSLSSCLIQPMTYKRLQSIKSSRNLQYRLQEEQRLDLLAQQTLNFAV